MANASIEQIFPLGLASVSLKFDDFSGLRLSEENGVELLELTLTFPDSGVWRITDPGLFEDLLRKCDRHRVRINSVHSYFLIKLGHDMVSADPEIRKSAVRLNSTLFQTAMDIDAEYVVIHLFNEEARRSADETHSLAKDAVNALLPYAEKTGVKMAIENLNAEWSVDHINKLLDDFNHPLLGICFDTGHSALYSDSVGAELALSDDRLLGLHIHDNLRRKDNHFAPFRGQIDWRDFAEGLVKTGYKGPLMIESFEREAGETREHFIAACVDAYRRLLELIEDASSLDGDE